MGNWSIIGRLLRADYQPTDNRPVPYWCISKYSTLINLHEYPFHSCVLSVISTTLSYMSINTQKDGLKYVVQICSNINDYNTGIRLNYINSI